MHPHVEPRRPVGREWLVLAVFVAASFAGIHCYFFPGSNHCITVPFVQHLLDPSLFPGDPLVAERANFHTLYDELLAGIVRLTGWSIPVVFVAVYVIALCAAFFAFFRLALVVGGRRDVALFATSLFLFGTRSLGSVLTLEGQLLERTLALPLQLWAIAEMFERRVLTAFTVTGVAFLIHPLSGTYCLAAMLVAGLFEKGIAWTRLAAALGVAVVISLPVTLPKLLGGVDLPFFADEAWVELLMFRSAPHLDVRSWPPAVVLGSVAFLVGFLWLARRLEPPLRGLLIGFGLGIAALCVAGFVFVDLLPISIVVQLQPFRSFRFLFYVGLALFARHVSSAEPGSLRLASAVILVAIFYGPGEQSWHFVGAVCVIALWFFAWSFVRDRHPNLHAPFLAALLAIVVVGAIIGAIRNGGPWVGTVAPFSWGKVQTWARQNTPVDAGFIVSPDRRGFRVYSERAIYGDWKDGTQTFFNPAFGTAWLARMRRLGFEDDLLTLRGSGFTGDKQRLRAGYRELTVAAFEAIAREMPKSTEVYAVVDVDRTPLALPIAFETGKLRVYRVR